VDGGVCGDGTVEGDELCDDGDTIASDGCSSICQVETGWNCPPGGGACTQVASCGNSVLESGESCDDGDSVSGDGCSAQCLVESGWSCGAPGTACVSAACGDGVIAGLEE